MPTVTIAYREGVKSRSSSPWAMMHHMLSSFSPVHHKRSSVVSLQVRPLPPTDRLCIGVGKILSIIRASNAASLRSGEAGSIVYRLQGSVHPNELQIPIPQAIGVPAKVYSSAYKSQGAYPHYDYEQEYVIHPQEEGVVRFEEQVLWYFDPKKESYESYIVPDFELYKQVNYKTTV